MDCARVLAISDGQLAEYDEPMKMMSKEESLFGQLVKEYWSHSGNASANKEITMNLWKIRTECYPTCGPKPN
ncbi:ABC transporter C family member 10 [Camellia lanceoleosa]|uniref:ABC transporter C family member 10 n=1 Tax=Camellia lanceoleosa TaxID=1840588 RepID=A0ACC0FKL0_9ERIC|nr:ABC transporter C family member 10 [Camellia lanceoleosa]